MLTCVTSVNWAKINHTEHTNLENHTRCRLSGRHHSTSLQSVSYVLWAKVSQQGTREVLEVGWSDSQVKGACLCNSGTLMECLFELLAITGHCHYFWLPSRTWQYDLWLKIPYSGAIEHGIIKLVWTSKLHPYWLALIVLEGAGRAFRRRKVMALF